MRWRNLFVGCSVVLLLCLSSATADTRNINCATDIAGCCCFGARGNVDCDFNDVVDILDLAVLIDHLFIDFTPLPSYDEANVDGEGTIDISDITRLIDHLYISQSILPVCPGIVNHAPRTRIGGMDSTLQPFINTLTPNAVNTGVARLWLADDKLDHPYEPQPLSYQWRLYGPYDSATTASIYSQFRKVVFVTTDDEVLPTGQAKFIPFCDTTWSPIPPYVRVTCDTMFVDTVSRANRFGTLDTLLAVESDEFTTNPTFSRVAIRSGSGSDSTSDSSTTVLYDFFRDAPNDVTTLGFFILWVRAIDHDFPPKADPAPPFEKMLIVDPKHENDLIIVDAQISYEINARKLAPAKAFWDSAIDRWRPGISHSYHMISQSTGNILSAIDLLSHKVVIVLSDDVVKGVAGTTYIARNLISASVGGTNVWYCGRTMMFGNESGPPSFPPPLGLLGPWLDITKYGFGGWSWYYTQEPSVRVEDFIGADPIDSSAWPILVIDSANLHSRYSWGGEYYPPWVDSLAALPEVAGFWLTEEAEVLYNYNSLYTGYHPLIISQDYFFDGKPVVYRIDRTAYRLFVSSFTPYSLAGDSVGGAAQVFVDSALNWLYQPFNLAPHQSSTSTALGTGSSRVGTRTNGDALRMKSQRVQP